MSKRNGSGGNASKANAKNPSRQPENARVIKSSAKTGTVSRQAARSAVKAISGKK